MGVVEASTTAQPFAAAMMSSWHCRCRSELCRFTAKAYAPDGRDADSLEAALTQALDLGPIGALQYSPAFASRLPQAHAGPRASLGA